MRGKRNKDAATKGHRGDIREFVTAYIRDEDGFDVQREAASLTDLRQACAAAGKMSEFEGHCVFEEVMQNRYRAQLADLDADDSFVDDADESGEYKRQNAMYLLVRELNETLFHGREQLATFSLNGGCD